ncbi:hypothetical protein LTR35_012962 [Friedmanniomyces endolithicus]|uniref:Uncharacterized protein n=1 Tax=Friedmanniomyces endolithicus TaxID=329885 RepID=A0AAN6FM82_9PEZI|nr:hypothetical protein LTR35_012962 [Friedmanniomyces endolithicus]KAK0285521.1 hypothetical protein LTS00_010882 [Friedmanniomyces endolithicus]KAK0319193.1 hypothetical protein LTR82_009957 [Friedmanniomyces endolithicus]KAK0977848.1 hypothetical protein LTR54_016086 [Friedmanniomyces endolithicus]
MGSGLPPHKSTTTTKKCIATTDHRIAIDSDNMTAMNHGRAAIANALESSRLWLVPPELRSYIYELTLSQPQPIESRWFHDSDLPESLASTSSYMAGEFLNQIGRVNKLAMRSVAIHVGVFHSVTTPFFTMALDEILVLAKQEGHVTFEAQVIIMDFRAGGHSRRLAIQVPNIAASFHALALEKEGEMQDRKDGAMLQQDLEALSELREAHQIWVAKALKSTGVVVDLL